MTHLGPQPLERVLGPDYLGLLALPISQKPINAPIGSTDILSEAMTRKKTVERWGAPPLCLSMQVKALFGVGFYASHVETWKFICSADADLADQKDISGKPTKKGQNPFARENLPFDFQRASSNVHNGQQ